MTTKEYQKKLEALYAAAKNALDHKAALEIATVIYAISQKEELTGSEAVYGFVAWLTTCEEVTTMGKGHDCGLVADLVKEFCDVNKLSEPRHNWSDYLTHPSN